MVRGKGESPSFLRLSRKRAPYICLLLILLTAGPILAGGNRKGSDSDTIQFWHSVGTQNKNVLVSLIDGYHESDQQTTVQPVFQGSDRDLYLKLLSQENPPELILLPLEYLHTLREEGIIADISPFIPNRLKGEIDQGYWDSLRIDESIYGVPFSFDTTILYVNQNILSISGSRRDREPATWNDILPIIRRIRDYTDEKWSIFVPMDTIQHFAAFVESYSGRPLLGELELNVNSPEAIDAITTLQNFVYRQEFMPPKLTSDEADQLFLSGNLGILMESSARLVYTQSNLPYNLTVWSMPLADELSPLSFGSCLAVSTNGIKRGREIFSVIEYLTNFESAVQWHTHTGSPAILNSAKSSLDLLIFYEENPNYMTPIIDIERGRIFAPRFDIYGVDTIMRKALDNIMVSGEDPFRILDGAQRELDLLLLSNL
jgi:ABC-type glycerol-3-phosphate transport system substrate-binding protein